MLLFVNVAVRHRCCCSSTLLFIVVARLSAAHRYCPSHCRSSLLLIVMPLIVVAHRDAAHRYTQVSAAHRYTQVSAAHRYSGGRKEVRTVLSAEVGRRLKLFFPRRSEGG